MERKLNRANLRAVYRMLFEIAKGNLAYQIKRTNHKDKLEGLVALLNLTAQKLNNNRNQFLWFNRGNEVVVIKTAYFLLNNTLEIIDYSCQDWKFEMEHKSQKVIGRPYEELLVSDSLQHWRDSIQQFFKQGKKFHNLRLQYKVYGNLILNLHSLIIKITSKDDFKFIVISSLLDTEKDDFFNLQENATINKVSIWDQQLFQDIQEYIMFHLDEKLVPLNELAFIFNTNEHKIKTGFKEIYGLTPFQYHQQQRIAQSKILIERTNLSLSEIALKMGFKTYPQFSKSFKSQTNFSPRKYQNFTRNS